MQGRKGTLKLPRAQGQIQRFWQPLHSKKGRLPALNIIPDMCGMRYCSEKSASTGARRK